MVDKKNKIDEIDAALAKRFSENISNQAPPPLWNELFTHNELGAFAKPITEPISNSTTKQYISRKLILSTLAAAVVLCGLFLYVTPDTTTKITSPIATVAVQPILKQEPVVADITPATTVLAVNKPTRAAKKINTAVESISTVVEKSQSADITPLTTIEAPKKPKEVAAKAQRSVVLKQEDTKAAYKDAEKLAKQRRRYMQNIANAPKVGGKNRDLLLAITSSLSTPKNSKTSDIMPLSMPPMGVITDSNHSSVSFVNFEGETWSHHFPLDVALSAKYEVYKNLYLGAGVSYSRAKSTTQTTDRHDYKLTQTVNYIGVPISVSYKFFDANRFSVYGNLSTMAEFNISTNRTIESFSKDNLISTTKTEIENNTPLFSIQTGIGAAYNLSDNISIFGEPSVNFSFNNNNKHIPSYKTESDYQFSFRFGFNFNI